MLTRSPDAPDPLPRAYIGLVLAVVTAIYVTQAPAQAAWGDGLSFLYTSEAGFDLDTNATAHVLYANLGVALTRALPFWPNAGVLVGLSLVSALVALGLLYGLARDGASRAGALFGTVVLALSFTFWRHAVTIEVYAVHLAFVAAILSVATRSAESRTAQHAAALGALWGVSLLVHIQNVLLAPAALYYLLRVRPGAARLAAAALAFAVPASLLVALPLALGRHDVSAVFFDRNPGGVLALDPVVLARGAALSVAYAVYNFHIWLVAIAVGALRLWRERPAAARVLALVAGTTWLFAMRYAVSDSYVFYLTAYAAVVPCAATGFDTLLARFSAPIRTAAVVLSLSVSPLLYSATLGVARATSAGQRIEATKGYKGGLAFYLYPGMRGAPDPLDLARRWRAAPDAPPPPWNVRQGIRYLDLVEPRSAVLPPR